MNMSTQELLGSLNPAAKAQVMKQLGERPSVATAPRERKYRNKPVTVDGVRFDSMREAGFYQKMEQLRRAGHVKWFCIQPSFVLEGGVIYRADFIVCWSDGQLAVIDAKSPATAKEKSYRNKKRQVRARYGLEIREV